jgi:alkanesulfonate monooxygenase SsuD/methylene tetrahydromethanopterin reductase-like flavin-dependent oxidoreductase (luciferase family)
MEVDLLLVPFGATYPMLHDAAVAAEEAGFDGVWMWDHLRVAHGGGQGVPEVLTALAGIAATTRRIAVGPLVLNVANRHPGLLANSAATLQQIAGGRLLLGIGAGGGAATPYAREQTALGLPVPGDAERARRVAEAAQVLKLLWAGGSPTFAGRYYTLDQAEGFLHPQPPPPIIVGAFGERMARIAGQYADGLNTQAFHPELPAMIATARKARAAGGRDPEALAVTVFAGLSERLLRADSAERRRLTTLGVNRLILLLEPPFAPAQIHSAGALLHG